MENYNFIGCESLSFDDIMTIEGGGLAYDLGHFVGSIGRDIISLALLKKMA